MVFSSCKVTPNRTLRTFEVVPPVPKIGGGFTLVSLNCDKTTERKENRRGLDGEEDVRDKNEFRRKVNDEDGGGGLTRVRSKGKRTLKKGFIKQRTHPFLPSFLTTYDFRNTSNFTKSNYLFCKVNCESSCED